MKEMTSEEQEHVESLYVVPRNSAHEVTELSASPKLNSVRRSSFRRRSQ